MVAMLVEPNLELYIPAPPVTTLFVCVHIPTHISVPNDLAATLRWTAAGAGINGWRRRGQCDQTHLYMPQSIDPSHGQRHRCTIEAVDVNTVEVRRMQEAAPRWGQLTAERTESPVVAAGAGAEAEEVVAAGAEAEKDTVLDAGLGAEGIRDIPKGERRDRDRDRDMDKDMDRDKDRSQHWASTPS